MALAKILMRRKHMQKVLKDLTPNSYFMFFEELTQIPRCSGNEKQVSDYLVNFARIQIWR